MKTSDASLESLRTVLLGKKDINTQKQTYQQFSEEQQKEVWLDKLNQILDQNLPDNVVKSLILDLKNAVKNALPGEFNKRNQNMMAIGLELADALPRNDFLTMFCTISGYTPSNVIESKCADCMEDIKKSLINDLNGKPRIKLRNGGITCNCEWTCSFNEMFLGVEITTDCVVTLTGCGFLWTQPCEKALVVPPPDPEF